MYNDFADLSLIEFAQHIRVRPSMYFGKDIKLSHLENMLLGFSLNGGKESIVPFQYFNYWAKNKLNKFGSKYNWAVAIKESCNQDEEKAFWKFYELLDEFMALRPLSLFVTELTAGNFEFYYSQNNQNKQHRIIGDDNRYIVAPAPYVVKLFDFGYSTHAYHFDYYWLVEEYDKNMYNGHFDTMDHCKAVYKDRFNISTWTAVTAGDEIQKEFENTIVHCRNRRQNVI